MIISNDTVIYLILLVPVFTITILRSAIVHLFELGKSKSRCKKNNREMSLVSKIMLFGYVEACDHHTATANRLRLAYWASFTLLAVSVVVLLCSLVSSEIVDILKYIFIVRLIVLDIPVFLLFFVMTKHGKNGGVTWKWDVND